MLKLISILGMAVVVLTGCGPVQTTVIRDQPLAAYKQIFKHEKPEDVDIIHSCLVKYTPKFMVITTPDYEIELIVPESWIDKTASKLHLRKLEDRDSHRSEYFSSRQKNRGNDWYVPKDISQYDMYYMFSTSIPYVHMLVDKEKVDHRYRVFVSKH